MKAEEGYQKETFLSSEIDVSCIERVRLVHPPCCYDGKACLSSEATQSKDIARERGS